MKVAVILVIFLFIFPVVALLPPPETDYILITDLYATEDDEIYGLELRDHSDLQFSITDNTLVGRNSLLVRYQTHNPQPIITPISLL